MVNCNNCRLNLSCRTWKEARDSEAITIISCGRFSSLNLNRGNETHATPENSEIPLKVLHRTQERVKTEKIRKFNLPIEKETSVHYSINLEKREHERQRKKLLHDMERGRGGPDISGLKKMLGFGYTSSLAENAKRKLSNG